MLKIRKEQSDELGPDATKSFESPLLATPKILNIREEQMDVFQQQAEIKFVDYVAKQLRNNHAEVVKDIPEDKLHKRVEYGIQRAREYGLTWQNDLTVFVTLMFEIAPDFDKFPAFREYLTDKTVEPDERMDLLLSETTEIDWEDAQEASAKTGWPGDLM